MVDDTTYNPKPTIPVATTVRATTNTVWARVTA
jgi:hypothetical protein